MPPSVSFSPVTWLQEQWNEHHADLMRYSMSLTHDGSRAEDAVQETYVRLMRADPDSLEGKLRPWLFRVCRSRVLDMMRKEGRIHLSESPWLENQVDPSPSPATLAVSEDRARLLLACISGLPALQQEAIRLKFQGGLSYREIAEVMDKTVSHVGVLIHQGLANLRKALADPSNPISIADLHP